MAQDGEVSVKLRITAEDGGVAKAKQGLKHVEDAAKGGFERMQAGVRRVSGAFGALRNVLAGFGIGGVVMAVTGGLARIAGSFGAAKKSAEEFRAVQARLAEDKAIAGLANDYARLTDAVAAASAAESHQLEMIDIEVANRRKLAEAKLEAAKEDEIAGLDTSAGDYGERLAAIEKKYAAIRAAQTASDAKEDIVLGRQKVNAQADQADARAGAQDAATKAVQAKISAARRAKSAAEVEAVALNGNDKTGAASAVGKTLGQLFTGDWGRLAGAKTAEGDEVRKAAAERAAQYERQIQQLEEEKRRSEAKAAELRKEAERLREKADRMGVQVEAAEISGGAARRAAAREESEAQGALADRQAKTADAERARRLLAGQKADIQARIAAEQARKDAAGRAVYEAQGDYDAARLGGSRRAQQSALGSLQAAQGAAQDVNHAADRAIGALTETLRSVEARLKAAQGFLESQSKQQRNAWAETPAGS